MKTVAKFINQPEAQVAKGFLTSHGIDAIIGNEKSLSAMPHLTMGMNSFQLMVAEHDVAHARRLLDEVEREHAASKEEKVEPRWTKKETFLALALLAAAFAIIFGYNLPSEVNRHALGLHD